MHANGNGKANGTKRGPLTERERAARAAKRRITEREKLFSEYDDQDTSTTHHQFYAELEWVRIERQRKPGWTGFTFKELFGAWPKEWLKTLTPQEPRPELLRWIKRRDNAFKRERRKREADAKASNGTTAVRATHQRSG